MCEEHCNVVRSCTLLEQALCMHGVKEIRDVLSECFAQFSIIVLESAVDWILVKLRLRKCLKDVHRRTGGLIGEYALHV